ncbi:hypothetical protein ACTNDN_20660 [Niallia sp. HCP3S3_B10]|uniref:hypothetical protein n=1 Tax=Niallia sp. HCP3S3_B10 TaxID=3438944 RepID=UPI003F8BE45B
MATFTLDATYTLNESEAKMLAETPRRKVVDTGIFNDLNLTKSDRIKRAANILDSRR